MFVLFEATRICFATSTDSSYVSDLFNQSASQMHYNVNRMGAGVYRCRDVAPAGSSTDRSFSRI